MIYNLFAVHIKLLKLKGNTLCGKHRKKHIWQHGTCCQLVYSVLFSVLPTVQSFLAQLLGKAVALTIIIGDFFWTWASHEQNNRETCFIRLYKAIQINGWDNIMIINDWKKINKFLAETNFGSCANVYILMPSILIILQIKQVT